MIIQINEVAVIFEKIIAKLKKDGVERIELNQDMYWFLSNKDSYDMKFTVESPLIGSFMDDWAELRKVSQNERIMSCVDFERMSFILKAISEELSPEE